MTLAQRRALQELWPEYGLEFRRKVIDVDQIFEIPAQQADPGQPHVVLEIGFGMGDSLIESVRACPNTCFLGIEVHGPGVGHLMQLAASHSVSNLRIYRHDAIEVLQYCIPDNCLDVVQIYFPDPWPKKKHQKRRLIQPEFVQLVGRKLKDRGVLHLATDLSSYAKQIEQIVTDSNQFEISNAGRVRTETKYERRARRLGHKVADLVFKKTISDNAPIKPDVSRQVALQKGAFPLNPVK